MPTRELKIDGNTGRFGIVNFDGRTSTFNDPFRFRKDVYFHSEMPYIQFKEKIITNISFERIVRPSSYIRTMPLISTRIQLVGQTNLVNPLILLRIDGLIRAGGYQTNQSSDATSKNVFYPVFEGTSIYILYSAISYVGDIAFVSKNIEIYIGNR